MTAHRNEKIHLVEKGVLTEHALLAYLHNTLTPEERREVERLLQSDPFAKEAWEGMQDAPSKTEASSSLLSINQKIKDRVEGRRKGGKLLQLHWTSYAWAAVVLGLLISLGFVLVNFMGARNENIAMNSEPAAQETPEVSKQEPQLISADKSEAEESGGKVENQPPVVSVKPDEKANQVPVVPNAALKTAPPVSEMVVTAPSAVPANEGLAKEKSEVGPSTATKSVNSEEIQSFAMRKKAEDKSVGDDALKEVTVETAMKSFNSGDYKTSAAQFDILLKQQPNNADALYFGGISSYINDDIRKSEKSFDALLKEGTRFVEGSKWYKANILLKKGKKEEAKKLLQDLSITGGSYKERANKKLGELEP